MMTKQVSVIMVTMQCNDNYDDGVGVYDVIDDNGVGATGCESKVSLVSGKCNVSALTMIMVVSVSMMLIMMTMLQGVGTTGHESVMSLVIHPLMSLTHNERTCVLQQEWCLCDL